MSYIITSRCIACNRCHIVYPTSAISLNDGVLLIDPTAYHHCQDYYNSPRCIAGCPINTGCSPGELCSSMDQSRP